MKPEMSPAALIDLLDSFESASIPVCLDGSWGVDALLGAQHRPHHDVDIVLSIADVPKLTDLLRSKGFTEKEGEPPDSFVMHDVLGHEVDIHAVTFDASGNGIYHMQNGEDWIHPAEGFAGIGRVCGLTIRCLTPAIGWR